MYVKDVIFWEGAFAESLVNLRQRASRDRLSVGGSLRVLCHGMLLWRAPSFKLGCLSLPVCLPWMYRRGCGSCIDGFRGWMVVVIVGGRPAWGLRIIGTVDVSRSTTSKKDLTPNEFPPPLPQMEIKSNQILEFILVIN